MSSSTLSELYGDRDVKTRSRCPSGSRPRHVDYINRIENQNKSMLASYQAQWVSSIQNRVGFHLIITAQRCAQNLALLDFLLGVTIKALVLSTTNSQFQLWHLRLVDTIYWRRQAIRHWINYSSLDWQ